MATAHYCTYFDHRYLSLGLALYESMRRQCKPFRLWVLCLTEQCHEILSSLALPEIVPLRLTDLEAHDAELLSAKGTRSTIDYYYTCTPATMAWLFAVKPEIDVLTYLDSDLYFFGRPDFLFELFKNYSVMIVPHNFSERNRHFLEKSGIYNVGWLSFRRDEHGLACLDWWRRRCLETTAAADGQCGDQKYLNEFPEKFAGVYITRHPGVDLAPWNLGNYQFAPDRDGRPTVDGQPVIFFHFSQLRRVTSFLWRAPYSDFGLRLTAELRSLLFHPYLADVRAAEKLTGQHLPAPTLMHGRSFLRRNRLLATLRELAAIVVRGGGIWSASRQVS